MGIEGKVDYSPLHRIDQRLNILKKEELLQDSLEVRSLVDFYPDVFSTSLLSFVVFSAGNLLVKFTWTAYKLWHESWLKILPMEKILPNIIEPEKENSGDEFSIDPVQNLIIHLLHSPGTPQIFFFSFFLVNSAVVDS